ncbi:DgyrCDS11460 [Dimorphilus gyrociliatus]|uniref:DgyrCDS11460 n=1 Tax=Dimorphilus gyrociliatus TaxID=2664684 RepID=A0A7I8W5Y1_9ANNE|nr:DgyrCDS11460 [Dimorphilus gyrociliatus]
MSNAQQNSLNGLQIQSTAGAVPVRNKKGEIVMEKVKVTRYVTGKRPDFAALSSSEGEEEEEEEKNEEPNREPVQQSKSLTKEINQENEDEEDETERVRRLNRARHRVIAEPEILDRSSEEEESEGELKDTKAAVRVIQSEDEEEDEEEPDEDEIERRRAAMRAKARAQQRQDELMEKSEAKEKYSDDEESEYEEYTDSSEEEEDDLPRLRPVFVKKNDRATVSEREAEEKRLETLERQQRNQAEAQRRETLRQIEAERKRELEEEAAKSAGLQPLEAIITDDEEGDEEEYESWKVRELKRIKRERDQREEAQREMAEVERRRNLTEEQRQKELKENPKLITNQQERGKYKFMQKYYHRGVFYLDEDNDVLKRNFAEPTLEDHFDKTVLPKVMQVKDFGRSGRTKYTHLVDQDTTQFDSPWVADSATNQKFHSSKGGGMKQVFKRPSKKKDKND